MTEMNDHDLLIVIAQGQRELQDDVKAMSAALREMKTMLDATNERQRDQDVRLVNLSNTVVRVEADRRDDRNRLDKLFSEHNTWKLYMKVALVLLTPVYLVIMALIIEAGKKLLFP